ncbi:hypothetical protein [Nocardia sp. NBC_01327]|uniref:hypothetical protein n=1 Tax=Nocardia sp. NBC_01327 TaxID=2903593 RepID=UPI002E0F11B3|nr:hypothetical protein OG326_16205 [Nocardia sp. NBC_01327]
MRDESVDTVVLEVLDALARDAPEISDVAVVYRTVTERRATVSALADGIWQRASHVSIKVALLALAQEAAGTGNLMVLELLDHHTAFVLATPRRTQIMAADSWSTGVVDAPTTQEAIGRIWPILNAMGLRPDAVLVCGSALADPAVAEAVRLGFTVPVTEAPDPANAVARGGALVVAGQSSRPDAEVPTGNRRPGLVLLGVAVAAATLAATGFTLVQIREHTASVAQVHMTPAGSSAALAPTTQAPAPIPPPEPITDSPAPPPAPEPITDNPAPIITTPPKRTHPAHPTTTDPAVTTTTTTDPTTSSVPPTSTKVGAPDANWLFPGESPPPPAGSDPAQIQAWWDNHLALKDRWLHGG